MYVGSCFVFPGLLQNSSPFITFEMKKEKALNEDNQRKRYNEKEVIKKFLVSERGVTFLVDHTRGSGRSFHESGACFTREALEQQVDNIVDYYSAWINNFPVRRGMKISRYEFLKHLEDFCSKNDVGNLFDFLFV